MRRDLVHADATVHHERVLGAKSHQRLGDDGRPLGLGDTDHLALDPGGVRQGANQVHQRGRTKLAPDRPHMFHRGMKARGKQKDDACFLQHATRVGGVQYDANAECFQDISGAAARCVGAIAMLGNHCAGAAGDECGHRGDVERRYGATAGAARIHQVLMRGIDSHHRVPQRPRGPGEFVGSLAFRP